MPLDRSEHQFWNGRVAKQHGWMYNVQCTRLSGWVLWSSRAEKWHTSDCSQYSEQNVLGVAGYAQGHVHVTWYSFPQNSASRVEFCINPSNGLATSVLGSRLILTRLNLSRCEGGLLSRLCAAQPMFKMSRRYALHTITRIQATLCITSITQRSTTLRA